jgi:hypothetical protein
LWLVARDRIRGDAQHLAVEKSIAAEVDGIDFNLPILAGMDESDIPIQDQGIDLKMTLGRHDPE